MLFNPYTSHIHSRDGPYLIPSVRSSIFSIHLLQFLSLSVSLLGCTLSELSRIFILGRTRWKYWLNQNVKSKQISDIPFESKIKLMEKSCMQLFISRSIWIWNFISSYSYNKVLLWIVIITQRESLSGVGYHLAQIVFPWINP
jgi:hypothetical protein